MKKIILAAAAAMLALSAAAQFVTAGANKTTESALGKGTHVVGEQLEINGVPACIFYLSEDGHGLAFTFPAMTEKQITEAIKTAGKAGNKPQDVTKKIEGVVAQNLLDNGLDIDREKTKKGGWLSKKKKKEVMGDLIDRLGDKGLDNQKAILEYAEEKGYDLESVFPAQTYCRKLGENWFIPANDELEKLSLFLFGVFGEGEAFTLTDVTTRMAEIQNNPQLIQAMGANATAMADPTGISTVPAYFYTLQTLSMQWIAKSSSKKNFSILSSKALDPEIGFMAMICKDNPAIVKNSLFSFKPKTVKNQYYETKINGGWQGEENVLDSMILPVYAF